MNDTLIRRVEDAQTHMPYEEWHMKTEAEIGVMHLQTKECQGLLANTRS